MINRITLLLFIGLAWGQDCNIDNSRMHFTGQTKTEMGTLLREYKCPSQHAHWLTSSQVYQNRSQNIVPNQKVKPMPNDAYASMGYGLGMLTGVLLIKGIQKLKGKKTERQISESVPTKDELYWQSLSPEERKRAEKENEKFYLRVLLITIIIMLLSDQV